MASPKVFARCAAPRATKSKTLSTCWLRPEQESPRARSFSRRPTEGSAVTSETTAPDTRELIIKSAFACFRRQGLKKATIVDIARAADISRSTVYEYYRDKAAIVEACAEHSSQRFYREMAKAMGRGESLEDKLTLAAVFVTRARRFVEPETYFDADEVSLLLTKNAAVLHECCEFRTPHLAAAKLTGEV